MIVLAVVLRKQQWMSRPRNSAREQQGIELREAVARWPLRCTNVIRQHEEEQRLPVYEKDSETYSIKRRIYLCVRRSIKQQNTPRKRLRTAGIISKKRRDECIGWTLDWNISTRTCRARKEERPMYNDWYIRITLCFLTCRQSCIPGQSTKYDGATVLTVLPCGIETNLMERRIKDKGYLHPTHRKAPGGTVNKEFEVLSRGTLAKHGKVD